MAFKKKLELSSDKTIKLGGANDDGVANPTQVEGYYLGVRITPDKGYGPGKLHFFQTKEGNVGVWGKSRLNNLLTAELQGQMVRATFTGMGKKQKGKNPAFLYEVEFDETNTIDVSGINLNPAAEPEAEESDESYVARTSNVEGDDVDDTDLDADESSIDAAPPTRATVTAPRRPALAPSATQQDRVKALLAGRGNKAS